MVPHRRVLRTSAVAALFAVSLAIPAAGQTSNKGDLSRAHIQIDNFGQVNTNYYRGAQPQGRDYADLAALGVKTVIDLTQDGDATEVGLVKKLGMNFYRIPMTTHNVPTAEQQAQFLKIVHDPSSQPVYVHCQGGRHRTGVMTAIYRMSDDGWTANQAFAEMKRYNFGSDFLHPEFKRFVYDFKPSTEKSPTVVAVTAPGLKP